VGACLLLETGGLASAAELDYVVFYDKPFVKFERLLQSYLNEAPGGLPSFLKAMPLWLKKKLWMNEDIAEQLDYDGRIVYTEHHESHAASAFFPSPFEEAAILTLDGVGEWATASLGVMRQSDPHPEGAALPLRSACWSWLSRTSRDSRSIAAVQTDGPGAAASWRAVGASRSSSISGRQIDQLNMVLRIRRRLRMTSRVRPFADGPPRTSESSSRTAMDIAASIRS
jgi:hypothetical protein